VEHIHDLQGSALPLLCCLDLVGPEVAWVFSLVDLLFPKNNLLHGCAFVSVPVSICCICSSLVVPVITLSLLNATESFLCGILHRPRLQARPTSTAAPLHHYNTSVMVVPVSPSFIWCFLVAYFGTRRRLSIYSSVVRCMLHGPDAPAPNRRTTQYSIQLQAFAASPTNSPSNASLSLLLLFLLVSGPF
jgi:hypothetical protein